MARDQGFGETLGRIGMHYFEGDGVEQDVDKGLGMLERAADRHDGEAMYYLGCSYRDGFNVDKDVKKSKRYLKKAAHLKCSSAYLALGDIYSRPEYGAYNEKKAAKWYLDGAGTGNLECIGKVIRMYSEGWLTEENPKKESEWREKYRELDANIYNFEW